MSTDLSSGMLRKKYLDFEEGIACERLSKLPPYEPRTYVPIKCPHCKVEFVMLPERNVRGQKAGECLKHLRVCDKYTGNVKEPPKRGPTNAELMDQLKAMSEENRVQQVAMEQRIVGAMERVSRELGLDPPPPKDENELLDKIKDNKRKREETERREREELDEERDDRNSTIDLTKCISCTKRRRKVFNYPCTHISECASCAESWKRRCLSLGNPHTCVQCRATVKRSWVGIF